MKTKRFKGRFSKFICLSSMGLVSIFFYVTPYISILGFKNALESENYELANSYINFNSLRESLKEQFNKPLETQLFKQFNTSNYSPLMKLVARPVVENVIEATISPKGLELLLRYGQLSRPSLSLNSYKSTQAERDYSDDIDLFYVNVNLFAIASYTNLSDQPIIAFWQREGLLSWRLASLQIPREILAPYI